jgi:hypothetical protein
MNGLKMLQDELFVSVSDSNTSGIHMSPTTSLSQSSTLNQSSVSVNDYGAPVPLFNVNETDHGQAVRRPAGIKKPVYGPV